MTESHAVPPHEVVILDLDGTVVDSRPAIVSAVRSACREVGAELAPDVNLDFCVGPPLEQSLELLLGGPDMVADAVGAFRRSYLANLDLAATLMPGCRSAIDVFLRQGLRLGIATLKPQPLAELVMERAGILEGFETVVGRDLKDDGRSKADLLSVALRHLDSRPDSTVYIGDRTSDEEAAAEVGVRFLRFGPLSWTDLRIILAVNQDEIPTES